MTRYLIGADIGTQSAKVSIFAEHGELVATGAEALAPLNVDSAGRAEHPGDDLWRATCIASRQAVDAFVAAGHEIASIEALGLCVIRCCRALLRSDGTLAAPVQSWMDTRLNDPFDIEAAPADVAWVTTASGYVTHRMTGQFRDTCANQIGWWPIDDTTGNWSEDRSQWEACQLTPDQLFDLVEPGVVLGELTAGAAEELGLRRGLPVVATAHDKAVEALGSGALEPGVGLISLGTYIAAMTHAPRHRDPHPDFWTFPAAVPGEWIHECMGVRRGMWAISWFRDQFGQAAVAAHEASHASGDSSISVESILEAEACNVEPGAAGLLTVPDWAAPVEAPFRKGAIIGFDGRHTRAHMYRSLLEGIALRLRLHMGPMAGAIGSPWREIVVSGGGANSDLMMQILADVFEVPTRRNRLRGGAAVGCAVNAGMAVGMYADPFAAAATFTETDKRFEPDPAVVDTYRTLGGRMAGIHDVLDPAFERWRLG